MLLSPITAASAASAGFLPLRSSLVYLISRVKRASASIAFCTFFPMDASETPTTILSQRFTGIKILFALLCHTATAIRGVISPSMESAITIPTGPMITSARAEATTTEFSPVAA